MKERNNPKWVICHIDTDKIDCCYSSVEEMSESLRDKYGLASSKQVLYKNNGCSYDILIKSKLGNTMRNVGFYYTTED